MAQIATGERFILVSVKVQNAHALDALDFQRSTIEAYGVAAASLADRRACHPIRFWNFIPGIHSTACDAMDRYMVFNAGRFAAFSEWFGEGETLDMRVATATGVGHYGKDLVIHVLTSDQPGHHMDNPRQARPRCYSCQYGPLPPCFARASVIQKDGGAAPLMLAGGTSSVRGEVSVHPDDLEGQLEETLHNLSWLLLTSQAQEPLTGVSHEGESDGLDRFRELRVYFARREHAMPIRRLLADRLPWLKDVEYLHADICRRDLLVEIEGLADLDPQIVVTDGASRLAAPAPGRPEHAVP